MTTMTMVHFACDVCELVNEFVKGVLNFTWKSSVRLGYSRAIGELKQAKLYKEAEELSRQLKELN